MISAKVQVDSLLKSNKIVVILNDPNHTHTSDSTAAAAATVRIAKAEKINLINNRRQPNSNNASNRLAEHVKTKNETNEIIKLLELYGIQRKHITIVSINEMKNAKISEIYLRAYYCNNQDVKYPLVFMHGIYFGSHDEIEMAHNEGFLFELFKDTGLYNMSLDALMNNDFEEYDDYDDEDDAADTITDDEDAFAIEKVARLNRGLKLAAAAAAAAAAASKSNKTISTTTTTTTPSKSKPPTTFSQITNKRAWELSANECNSDYSSLYSVNKQSYCQNYIDNNMESKSKLISSKSEITASNAADLGNKSMVGDQFENVFETDSELARKITPPGQILATINKWADKTKEAIDRRNKSIIKKKNF